MAGPTLGEAVVEVGADTDLMRKKVRDDASSFDKDGTLAGRAFAKGFNKSTGVSTFGQLTFSFAQIATKGGLFLSTIVPLPTALAGVVAGAVAVTGAVGLAAGSMLSAGAAASSLALAIVGLKVGMVGVADAWKLQQKAMEEMRVEGKVSETTQKQLDAAMQRLAPSARAVVKELRQMAPAWGAMRREVQGRLFEGIAPLLDRVGKNLLPVVGDGLKNTAGLFNRAGQGIGTFLASAEGKDTVTQVLTGMNAALANLIPAAGNVARGLLTLFIGSQGQATKMSQTLLGITERFREWAAQITASGQFQEFLSKASTAAGALLGVLGGLGKVLVTVFSAGADQGTSMLQTMAGALDKFNEFLNSAKGQNALASFFDTIAVAGQTAKDLFSVFAPIVQGVVGVIQALTPAFDSLRATMLPIAQTVGKQLGKGLGEVASMITSQLVPAFQEMLPVIAPVVKLLASIFGGAVIGLIKGFVLILTGAFQTITGVFNIFKAIFTGDWALLWSSLGTVVQGAWNLIKGIIMVALNVGILGIFRKGLMLLRGLWTGLWNGLKAAPGIAWAFIKGVVKGGWEGIKAVFSGGGGAVRGIASRLWGTVRSLASSGMSAFWGLVKTGISKVVGFFRELPGKVWDKVKALIKDLKNLGKQAMDGLWQGLKNGAQKVWDKAKEIANGVKKRISEALDILSPSRVMIGFGEMVTKGLQVGMKSGQRELLKSASSIADTVLNGIGRPIVTAMPATVPTNPANRSTADPTLRVPDSLGQPSEAQMRRQAELNAEALAKKGFRLVDRSGNIQQLAVGA